MSALLTAFFASFRIRAALPLEILTLGLFTLVINGFLFWLVGSLGIGLTVRDFWAGFWGAIVTAIISWILSLFTGGLEDRRSRA